MLRKPNYRGWIFTNKVAIYEHFGEPLYGSVIGLAKDCLLYAIENRLKLVVKTKLGTATYDNPKVWLKGKRGEGEFNYPGTPLKFYFRPILADIGKRDKRKKLEKKERLIEDFTIPMDVKLRLKEVFDKNIRYA